MNDSIRILVVDDETSQRELVSGYLKKQGYQVVAAAGGQDALETFRREPVELILTDQRMPDLSGLDLLKAVRSLNPETQVIIMTAYGNVETAVTAMRDGAADYLTKPLNLDELRQKIQRIAERHQLYSENRALQAQLRRGVRRNR